jgi:hypothetical protein
MGYRLTSRICATSINRRTQGGAGDAASINFAPLRHLRHPLIGEGKVAQWRTTASRARLNTPAAPRPAGAYGWPTMALACSGDRRTQRVPYRAACFEKGEIALIPGSCACISAIGGLSTRPQRVGSGAKTRIQYQRRNALAITASADTVPTRQHALCDKAAFIGISSTRPHDDKSRVGFYARGLPHSLTFLGSNGARQALALCEKRQRYAGFEAKDRGGAGVGGKLRPVRFIDLLPRFRGPASQNLGGPVLKKLVGL